MADDMSSFRTDVEIENPIAPGTRRLVRGVLVDTGAELSWFPGDLSESLGVKRHKVWPSRQADGTVLERWADDVWVYWRHARWTR